MILRACSSLTHLGNALQAKGSSISVRFSPRQSPALLLFLFSVIAVLALPAMAARHPAKRTVRVRSISVEVKNVFDPSIATERAWPYRAANVLHIRTHPSVVLRQLLVRPGDIVTPALLEESERNLRTLPFVKDAKIVEVPVGNNEVDLLVRTQDTWTTQPQVNFGSEGGQSHFSAGFLEENVLGYGKTLSYFYKKNADGISNEFGYADPQFLNTRAQLSMLLEDIPGGNHQSLSLQRPFYSVETRYAGGFVAEHEKNIVKTFQNGNEINRYDLDRLQLDPYVGFRLSDDPMNVQRLTLRYRYHEDINEPNKLTKMPVPPNNTLSGPLLNWSWQEQDFIKETFVDRAERIEDINLGHQLSVGSGYSGRFLGATNNTVPFQLEHAFGYGGDGPWFGLMSYGTIGRYALYAPRQTGGRPENTLYYSNLNLYRHWLPEFPLTGVAHFEAAHMQNSDQANPLSLGGDTGLRGFKVNAFTGNKSLLMNLENRFFYPYEVLRLAYLGGAVFFDAGQVQPQGVSFNRRDFHANVGVGMRIGLTRSTEGTVYRIDVAYALGHVDGDRVIVSISSGQGFGRSGNTYGKVTESGK